MVTAADNVLLAQSSDAHELLLREALASQGVTANIVPPYAHLETEITRALQADPARLLVVLDLGVLAQLGTSLAAFGAWARDRCPAAKLVLTCENLHAVRPAERRWARRHGALELVPGCANIGWQEQLVPVLGTLLGALGRGAPDVPQLERALAALAGRPLGAGAAVRACAAAARLAAIGIRAAELIAKMRGEGGVTVADRSYHALEYPECFVGSEAVDWIGREHGLTREAAIEAGQILLETGAIYHVAREQPFRDGHYFYRFTADSARLDALDLDHLLERLRGPSGVSIADRSYRGLGFPSCFIGAEAVDWMVNAAELSINEAMTLGQRLIELCVLHHVTDEHGFKDGYFFYRFYEDERER